MGEKWLEAFSKWPPGNQMAFSCIALMAFCLMLFFGGLWLYHLTLQLVIAFRGHPPGPPPPEMVGLLTTINVYLKKMLELLVAPRARLRLQQYRCLHRPADSPFCPKPSGCGSPEECEATRKQEGLVSPPTLRLPMAEKAE